jgi:hypothetical protein
MLSSTDRARAFRERMDAAGYKVRLTWVKKESEKSGAKITRRDFLGRLEELTDGMTDKRLSALYGEMLRLVKTKKEDKNKK